MIGPALGAISFVLLVHLWWRAGGTPLAGFDVTGPRFLVAAGPLEGTVAAAAFDLALLAAFFAVHSLWATLTLKARLGLEAWRHRQTFLAVTFVVLAALWAAWVVLPEPVLWSLPEAAPGYWALRVVQVLGLVGFGWTGWHFDNHEFFGRGPSRNSDELTFEGPFALVRHPSYFFMLLLLIDPEMPLGRALLAGAAIAYIAIGSRLEERKLALQFGEPYLRYRAQTPWLIPSPGSIARAFKKYS